VSVKLPTELATVIVLFVKEVTEGVVSIVLASTFRVLKEVRPDV